MEENMGALSVLMTMKITKSNNSDLGTFYAKQFPKGQYL